MSQEPAARPVGTSHPNGARPATGRWALPTGPRRAVLIGAVLVVLGIAAFLGVLDSVREKDDLAAVDLPVLHGLAAERSRPLTAVMTAVSLVTGPTILPVVVLLGAIAWGWIGKQRWQALLLAGSMIVSTVVSLTVKTIVHRPRPPLDTMTVAGVETTYSFPSGHTMGTATLLLVVGYLAWIRHPAVKSLVLWLVAILAGTFVVALSRLYLGYHFVTDVTASVALAVAVLGGVVMVDRHRAVRAARVTAAKARDAVGAAPKPVA
ncbi:MAG TPA: phosphatase PAP2 family protein [Actinotalea sp.]